MARSVWRASGITAIVSAIVTPVSCCGCECGVFDASLHLTVAVGDVTFSTSTIRTGLRSIRCNAVANQAIVTVRDSAANGARVGRSFAYFETLPAINQTIIGSNGSTGGVRFQASDSSLYCHSSGSGLGSTGIPVMTGRWYCIDWSLGSSSLVKAAIDGIQLPTVAASGIVGGQISHGWIDGSATAVSYFEDFVMSATAADYPIGSGYVDCLLTSTDGTHNIAGTGDFQRGNTGTDILNATTTAWQLIDDRPLPSGAVDQADNQRAVAPVNATDYVECLFSPVSDARPLLVPPRAVDVMLAHHQIATGTGSMDVLLNDNGTTDAVLTLSGTAGVVTYRYARKHYALAPTGGGWTLNSGAGNLRNLRVRFRSADANPDQCLDAIMIEAEFPDYKPRPPLNLQQAVNRASTF